MVARNHPAEQDQVQPYVARVGALRRPRRLPCCGHDVRYRGWPSAHVEQLLMEIARRQPLGDEALAQGLAEAAGPQNQTSASAQSGTVAQMRATSRRPSRALTSTCSFTPAACGVALQAGDEALVGFGGAVEQIDLAPVGRLLRQRLHAGDEGRDADAAADPDLPALARLAKSKRP